jgi:uncharacterized protein YndB with AHSA1/START domain
MDHSLGVEKSIIIKSTKPKIWKALTDPAIIKEYLFGTETITDWKVGSDLIFQGEWQGQSYKDKGHILEIIPEELLSYDYWSAFSGMEDLPENYATITYTLTDEEDGIRLNIRQQGFANEDAWKHSENGWMEVLGKIKTIVEQP